MTVVVCPSFATISEAIDYLQEKGCTSFHLHHGPDGLIRGHGTKDIDVPGTDEAPSAAEKIASH
jgi:hypothetical protein